MGGSPSESSALQFGAFKLDLESGEVYKNGTLIKLQPQPFKVLALLASHAGQLVTREEIQQQIWGSETFVDFEKGLNFCIKQIRAALGDDAETPHYIETLPKRGYRFIANVEGVGPAVAPAGSSSRIITDGFTPRVVSLLVEAVLEARRSRTRWLLWAAVAALATVAVAVGVSLWLARRPHLAFQQRDWVLIAAFENRTGEALLDGTLESALERDLSNSRFVNVVPRERIADTLALMKKPLNTRVDLVLGREICLRDGGIRALLTGRVEKLGSKYLLSASLVDPKNGAPVAGVSEEAANQDTILAAVQRLSNRLRKKLGETLPSIQESNEKLEKVTTTSLRALQLYSQGMALVNQSQPEQAAELLEQAIQIDPNFASAHVLLGDCYHDLRKWDKARSHYKKASELADITTDRERYFILGSYYKSLQDYKRAAQSYELLLRLYPDHYWAVDNLTWVYSRMGGYVESARYAVRRAQLRPNDFYSNFWAWDVLANRLERPSIGRPYLLRARKLASEGKQTFYPYMTALFELSTAQEHWQRDEIAQTVAEVDRVAQTISSRNGEEGKGLALLTGESYLTLGRLKAAEHVFQGVPGVARGWVAFLKGDVRGLRQQLSAQGEVAGPIEAKVAGQIDAILMARAGQLALARKELSLEKGDPGVSVKMVQGELALAQGRRAAAIALLQTGIEEVSSTARAYFLGRESLAKALEQSGNLQGAIHALEDSSRQKGVAGLRMGWLWMRNQLRLAQLYRKVGREQDAEKIEAELLKLLAYADSDHPILSQLKSAPSAARNPSTN